MVSLGRSKRTEKYPLGGRGSGVSHLMWPRASVFWAATAPLHPQNGKLSSICFFSLNLQEHTLFCSSPICRPLSCLSHAPAAGSSKRRKCTATRLPVGDPVSLEGMCGVWGRCAIWKAEGWWASSVLPDLQNAAAGSTLRLQGDKFWGPWREEKGNASMKDLYERSKWPLFLLLLIYAL